MSSNLIANDSNRELDANKPQNKLMTKHSLRINSSKRNINQHNNDIKSSSPTSISSFGNDNPQECSFVPIDNNENRMPKIK